MSSNSRPRVAVTSSVCGRRSLGGGRRAAFQESLVLLEGVLRRGSPGQHHQKYDGYTRKLTMMMKAVVETLIVVLKRVREDCVFRCDGECDL